jgi:Tfp pilus assembly PilM family ATPase
VSGPSLCLAVVRQASGSLEAARRFPMEAEQAPGEKGFPAFLNACLEALGHARTSADLWAVLRSSDLDLNVLAVPKLSGAKLDAAAYWTLQKEKKFADAEYALDYLVFGPTAGSKEPRLDILTCLARRSDVERLSDAFRDAGRPLTGVTAIPNALLALYRRPGGPTGYAMAANIHVEPDFSAIGLYAKDRLLFSRLIRSGAGSMAETLAEHFQVQARPKPAALAELEMPLPGEAEQGAPGAAAQPQALDAAQAHELMRHVLLGAPRPDFAAPEHLLSPQEMLEVLSPAIERLARQVERTLEYYATSQQGRCDALHLSGEIFGCPAIAQALAGQLGFPPVVFDAAAMLPSTQAQASPADSLILTPAIAAALAKADKGVNLIANYKVRTAQEAKRQVTRSIILGLAGVMVLIGGAGVVLEQANAVKQRELAGLRARAATLGPLADEGALKLTVERYRLRQEALRKASSRLLASASLADIARRAPENIRLLALNVEYPVEQKAQPGAPPLPGGQAQPGKGKAGADSAASQGTVLLEGVVVGERAGFDAALSRFIINLQSSPMFQMPVVNESGLKELGTGEQVLHFVMHVGVK